MVAVSSRLSLLAALVSVGTLASAREASAQQWMDREAALELRGPALPDASRAEKARAPQEFTATLAMPLAFSSNVIGPAKDSVVANRGDWHLGPEVSLKWSQQHAAVKITSVLSASMDRYASVAMGDVDAVSASFKAAWTDGRSDLFVPYVMYKQSMYFEPLLRRREIGYFDGIAGVTSSIGLRGGRPIPFADSSEAGDASISLDLRLGRRLSDEAAYGNVFVLARIDLTYNVSQSWEIEASPRFQIRWYDDYFGQARRDIRPGGQPARFGAPTGCDGW